MIQALEQVSQVVVQRGLAVAAQRVVEDRRWQTIQTLRADMARLLDALK